MDRIYVFSKGIKAQRVLHQEINDVNDVVKIEQVIMRLRSMTRVTQSNINEIALRTNPHKWAVSLINRFPQGDKENMANLLSDFTDSMKTRMREEHKYALGLLMQSGLMLCHSTFGEETITPEWKIIPRMLDTDNVLRYVLFYKEQDAICVEYWEREATNTFIDWLGLPHKAAFQFGGKYRVISDIEGLTTEFQLTELEMDDWISTHPEFKQGSIRLNHPVEFLNIAEIRSGRKSYDDIQDFIQDYNAEKYGIAHYQKEFERINIEALPLLVQYYDERTRLVRKEGDEEITECAKNTPGFDILFVNENISLRNSYRKDIVTRFLNEETIKVYHAGVKFRTDPLGLGSIHLYNRINIDVVTQKILDYFKQTNIRDKNLLLIIQYVIFNRLIHNNRESPLSYLFQSISEAILEYLVTDKKWIKLEDNILEYKSVEIMAGKNDAVIDKLCEDLEKKFKKSPCKVYLIGIEDDGTLNLIPNSKCSSDRVEYIRKRVVQKLHIDDLNIFRIEQNGGSILLLVAALNQ